MSPQSCSFTASFDDAHANTHCIDTEFKALPRLTKTAAIFGPNASGKTNLLMALRTMRELVLRSNSYSEAQFAAAYTPFRPGDSQRYPTEFRIYLLLGGVRSIYSFAYDSQRIVAESLHVHHGRKSQRWFGRKINDAGAETWTPFSPGMTGPRDVWRKATGCRSLFLAVAGSAGAEYMREIRHWFEHELVIVLTPRIADASAFAARVSDQNFKAQILGVFHSVDIRIDDIRVTQAGAPPHASSVAALPVQTVEFLHRRPGRAGFWLDFAHEASGIQRLIHILGALLDAIDAGTFIAIDEVDNSLHPLVARFLVQLINDPLVSRRRAQLMITSHNTRLMDLDILRRDEIWLMDLNADHASELSALMEQSPRKHERVAKKYLHGSFGAVPVINPKKWRDVAESPFTRPGPH